jgi:acetyltransferase
MSIRVDPTLSPFFFPRGVAVIGASRNPTKLGFGLARNLVQSGYQGAIHFVNPKGGRLFERPVYRGIEDIPDPVDLALFLIPAHAIQQGLQACGKRGIQAAILLSGGFREVGAKGAHLEDECLRTAREYGIRMIGPNCIGILDTHLPIDTTFLPPPGPTPGDVAFISHSGAICAAVIDWARGQGFGLSRLISLGNQADIRETDVLASVAADPHTRVLTLYLEGLSDGQRFIREAQRTTYQKPVIALKVGRFESGKRAVASHTGALAGTETAYKAAFRRAGVIRAETNEEMFDWARALAWCPTPKGRSVAILTNAGGPGVTAADALEAFGLELAQFEPETCTALEKLLPSAASVKNPVDMLATASPEHYARSLQILLDEPGVDSIMVILPPPPVYTAGGVARAMIPIIYAASKPVVVALMGERMIQEAVEYFRAARVPEYRFPERAASALSILVRRAEYLAKPKELPIVHQDVHPEEVYAALSRLPDQSSNFFPGQIADRILASYGIPTLRSELSKTPEAAVKISNRVGFPVALKVASPEIPHKSDIGGVILGLKDEKGVREGFLKIIQNVETAYPGLEVQGVTVQRMIPEGQEVIIGAVQDAQFGPMVMFGSGGVEVEGLKDVDFALAPITGREAKEVVDSTWAGQKLSGYRNIPPADRQAVLDALSRLAQLAADFPQLREIEINPLVVFPEGQGVLALDVRIRGSLT